MDKIPEEGKAGRRRGQQAFQTQKSRVLHMTAELQLWSQLSPLADGSEFVLRPSDDSMNLRTKLPGWDM